MTLLFALALAAAAPNKPYATSDTWDFYRAKDGSQNCAIRATAQNGTDVIIARAARLPGITRIMFRQSSWTSLVAGKVYPARLDSGTITLAAPAVGHQGEEGVWLLFALDTKRFKQVISQSPIITPYYEKRALTGVQFHGADQQAMAELDRCAGEADDPFK